MTPKARIIQEAQRMIVAIDKQVLKPKLCLCVRYFFPALAISFGTHLFYISSVNQGPCSSSSQFYLIRSYPIAIPR